MATNENSSMTVAPSEAAAAEMAVSAGLVYVNDQMPGLRRIRKGDGFVFVNSSGDPVTKESELRRIASLAIPPAYEDVWICAHACGHLQATGRDARMRKQYRYHAKWRTVRDQAKFDRMIGFAAALPKLRRVLRRDLAKKALPRSKVLAVVVSLLTQRSCGLAIPSTPETTIVSVLRLCETAMPRFCEAVRCRSAFVGKGARSMKSRCRTSASYALSAAVTSCLDRSCSNTGTKPATGVPSAPIR